MEKGILLKAKFKNRSHLKIGEDSLDGYDN